MAYGRNMIRAFRNTVSCRRRGLLPKYRRFYARSDAGAAFIFNVLRNCHGTCSGQTPRVYFETVRKARAADPTRLY